MLVDVEVRAGSGVKTTVTSLVSPSAVLLPVTVMTPVVALTVIPDAYFVDTKLPWQLSSDDAPADCTISVTQVRAELAANTTSDTLAFFV